MHFFFFAFKSHLKTEFQVWWQKLKSGWNVRASAVGENKGVIKDGAPLYFILCLIVWPMTY